MYSPFPCRRLLFANLRTPGICLNLRRIVDGCVRHRAASSAGVRNSGSELVNSIIWLVLRLLIVFPTIHASLSGHLPLGCGVPRKVTPSLNAVLLIRLSAASSRGAL